MSERREFILECQYIGGKVWTPDGLYALEGANEEVIRCRDCDYYAPTRCLCRRTDAILLDGDGHCSWGKRK